MGTKKLELVSPSDGVHGKVAEKVSPKELRTDFIKGIIDRMLELSAGKGHNKQDTRQMVGLAAVQLGISKRIITIDMTADGSQKDQTLQIFINPIITNHSEETVPGREGCWSCGNVCGIVDRFKSVEIAGLNREGIPINFKLTGFVARIAQHEVDHLNSVRFPDRIPVDEPTRLHWVEPSEFNEYREKWQTWETLCAREDWERIKAGKS